MTSYGSYWQNLLTLNFDKHCIAYIDILGAKAFINDNPKKFLNDLNAICNDAKHNVELHKILSQRDIFVKIFSDNILIGTKITSNIAYQKDKIENIIRVSGYVYNKALSLGYLTRGAITLGDFCMTEDFVYGKALIDAVDLEENMALYPRIITKKDIRDLFPNYFSNENDSFYALNTFLFTGLINNQCFKNNLLNMLSKNRTNNKIMQKVLWAINYYNKYSNSLNKTKNLEDLITEDEIYNTMKI